jgi:hypothetical protein
VGGCSSGSAFIAGSVAATSLDHRLSTTKRASIEPETGWMEALAWIATPQIDPIGA